MSSSLKVSERTEFTSWISSRESEFPGQAEALWPSSLIFFSHASLLQRWGAQQILLFLSLPAHEDGCNVITTVAGAVASPAAMASTTATSVDSLLNKSTKVKLSRSHSCCLGFSSNFVFFPSSFQNSEPHC